MRIEFPVRCAGSAPVVLRQLVGLMLLGGLGSYPAGAGEATGYPDLPRGITSFGAAVIGESLYVYGGHFGRAHHYSNTSQSDKLMRLNLRQPGGWEVVGQGPRLQGLAMVAYGGKLYRVGGFTAHNDEDAEHDLRSIASFARFDPETRKWTELPPMPLPRSSHDAVLIGTQLFVAGGWALRGKDSTQWHDTALSIDLDQDELVWKQLPQPPFRRRAISLGQFNGKLYVIGGMQQKGGPTTRVDIFDPTSSTWQEGPSLIGEGMDGFGTSACTVDDRLYVSTYDGTLQALSGSGQAWQLVAKLKDDRFFHRMLSFKKRLVLVGGASMESGKRLHMEIVELSDSN